MNAKVLVLAGTTEASELVRALVLRGESPGARAGAVAGGGPGGVPGRAPVDPPSDGPVDAPVDAPVEVVASFAGRTRTRVDLPGAATVRVGGFGGVDGLTGYLRDGGFAVLVDATHPFAAVMPWHAASAAAAAGVPRLRLLRPPWVPVPGDRWHEAADLVAAASALEALGVSRVFLTTGRQELAPFAGVTAWFLVRAIEPPEPMPLPAATVVLARGPFEAAAEQALMVEHRVEALVSKNSGGGATAAKLAAARALGIPVVMVRRPPAPPGPVVASVAEAVAWVGRTLS